MDINNYFYVILTAIVLLALFENFIPNSNTGKSVKRVISVACVLIILSPIINLFKGDKSEILPTGSTYNNYLQDYQNNLTETSVKHLLITEGYDVDKVIVYGIYDGSNYTVNKIQIKFKNLVINDDKEHINIIEKIENSLSTKLNIIKAEIVIDN